MFDEKKLMTLSKPDLVATAQQQGADITQATTKKEIVAKILEKLSVVPVPDVKEVPVKKEKVPLLIDKQEIADFFNFVIDRGAEVTKEGDVIDIKYRSRVICLNVNQPLSAIKRAVNVFMVG